MYTSSLLLAFTAQIRIKSKLIDLEHLYNSTALQSRGTLGKILVKTSYTWTFNGTDDGSFGKVMRYFENK